MGNNLEKHIQGSWENFESYQSHLDLIGNKEPIRVGSEDESKVIKKKKKRLANKDYTRSLFAGQVRTGRY